MKFRELGIKGAWLATANTFNDDRGLFYEWYRKSHIDKITGGDFSASQVNISYSKKGVIRGIHYSLSKQGQAKFVTCITGSIWDVIVDIRPKSPTFKKWIGVTLNSVTGDSLFISKGLGHAFISLEEMSIVSYVLSSEYDPDMEYEICPLDQDLKINWPIQSQLLSSKDRFAPTLKQQIAAGRIW